MLLIRNTAEKTAKFTDNELDKLYGPFYEIRIVQITRYYNRYGDLNAEIGEERDARTLGLGNGRVSRIVQ